MALAAVTITAFVVTANLAWADRSYHTERLSFHALDGAPDLRAGHVQPVCQCCRSALSSPRSHRLDYMARPETALAWLLRHGNLAERDGGGCLPGLWTEIPRHCACLP